MINVHTDYTLKGIGATGAASNSEEVFYSQHLPAQPGFSHNGLANNELPKN